MIRTCIICKNKHHPQALLRLQLDPMATLSIVERKHDGKRSAWVCCSKRCIEKLQKKKQLAQRALRKRPAKASDILGDARGICKKKIRKLVQACHHSGALKSGREKTKADAQNIKLVLLANPGQERYWRILNSNAKVYSLGLSSTELGSWLSRGPRQVIGILPNRHLQTLNEQLHLWDKLR